METKQTPELILSTIIVVGFFLFMGILIFVPMKVENKEMLNQVVGALIFAFSAVVGFWIGSSRGSQKKTDLLSKAQPIDDVQIEQKRS